MTVKLRGQSKTDEVEDKRSFPPKFVKKKFKEEMISLRKKKMTRTCKKDKND